MGKSIWIGITVGVLAVLFTVRSVLRGPGIDTPGEAYVTVLGVTVDHVPIPPGEAADAALNSPRVRFQPLMGCAVCAVVGAVIGGGIGAVVGRFQKREP